jgi:nicotinate-nucleotide adenylyltransferase
MRTFFSGDNKENAKHSMIIITSGKNQYADFPKIAMMVKIEPITKKYVNLHYCTLYLPEEEYTAEEILEDSSYVENILKISDLEIIDAIRYHTTAKADMSLLAKILYLADFTSADRDYEDVDVIREYVNVSLEKAFIYALEYSITDLVNNNKAVHLDTIAAYNQAVLGG